MNNLAAVLAPLIVCDGAPAAGSALPKCDISSVLLLIKNGMQDLVVLSTLLVVAVCVVAGMKLVTAGMSGNYGALKEARGMLTKILTGYVVILAAWVIIHTLAVALLDPKFYFFLGK